MPKTSPRRSLSYAIEQWPMSAPFRITGYTFTNLEVLVVTVTEGGRTGRGEAAGVYYLRDLPPKMADQVEAIRGPIEAGVGREELRGLLRPGGARNAVDCALWELEANQAGKPAWALAGLEAPRPLITTYTLGADLPELMAAKAVAFKAAQAIKIKLTGERTDSERVAAVRAARPDVWIGVDANQGYTRATLDALAPALVDAKVALLEQPFPVGQEDTLRDLRFPIPIAADESVQAVADIDRVAGLVDVVNIKLDKSGGLTEALAILAEIKRLGMQAMVGNMFGTSLAMAPAFLVGQGCDVVDLDGPMGLVRDREPAVTYDGGLVWCPPESWGGDGR